MMCWEISFPEDWLCSLTVVAPKVVVLDQVQANCGTVCDAKSLGLRVAHVTPLH